MSKFSEKKNKGFATIVIDEESITSSDTNDEIQAQVGLVSNDVNERSDNPFLEMSESNVNALPDIQHVVSFSVKEIYEKWEEDI